jgi:hypothetical protein
MFSSRMGEEIDNHDVVVRLNRGIELTKEFFVDLGKKTDILYSCLIEKAANAGKLNARELKEEYKVKYICTPTESTFEGIATQTKFHYLINKKTVKEINKTIPIRIVDHNFHNNLAKKIQCRPNTGFISIYDILRYHPQRLSIYGFSFYLDGFYPGCKKGINSEQGLSEEQFGQNCLDSKRHIQKNMWLFAKNTLLNNKQVVLDPVLKEILELEVFNKELYDEKKK